MAHTCKECGDPVGLGTVAGESGPSYSELLVRNQVLVNALKDLRWALSVQPSCQKGVVDKCRCLVCARLRVDAALKQ
jgi:hypothetical protein